MRWSTSTGRTGRSASAAPRARPTWPAPKISTSGSAMRSSTARARSAPQPGASSRATESSVRPPQHWPISGPRGMSRVVGPSPRAEHGAGGVDGHVLELAAADGAERRLRPDDHPGAGLARGRAAGGLDGHERGGRLVAAEAVEELGADGHRACLPLPAQARHRHQDALGRRRGLEARAGLVVGDAGDGHRQRLEDRDAEHERRLADRLGAADRRLAVLRPLRQRRR